MRGFPQDYFERYISELAYRREPIGEGLRPHYILETPHGSIAVDLASCEETAKIPEQVLLAERRAGKYRDLRVPYVLTLWKGSGPPSLEHRMIQEVFLKQRPRIISAITLLEGRAGHERLRVFHNPFTRKPLEKSIFDGPQDQHYYLVQFSAPKNPGWTAEEPA